MSEPVEQGGGELFVSEDLHPLGECEVGGDDGGSAFVAIGQQIEEQLPAGAVKRHESELVHDQESGALDPAMKPAELECVSGLEEVPHQIGCADKQHPVSAAGGLDAERDGEVGLAGADGPGDDHVIGSGQELAACQLRDRGTRDTRQRIPVDLIQGLDVRKPSPRG